MVGSIGRLSEAALAARRSMAFAAVAVMLAGLLLAPAYGARTILSENFEDDIPDALPNTVDFYARSSIAPDPDLDPSKAVVTGGSIADPFNPGSNKSLALHNPNGTTQMAVTWVSEFMDDPSTFRNGTVEFDLWLDAPDPAAFWTFFEMRLGHGGAERTGISGSSQDTTINNTFRLQNSGGNLLEQMSDPGHRLNFGIETTYTDGAADLFGAGRSFKVRYEIEGRGNSFFNPPVYRVKVSETTVQWLQDGATEHFWTFQPGPALAPGINILSFLTDASAHGANQTPGTGNVYIDNLVVINNDLPPLAAGPDFNDDGLVDGADLLIWQRGFGIVSGAQPSQGDANGDGAVNAADLALWKSAFGTAGQAVALQAVPEPAACGLVALALAGMLRLRRRF